MLLGCAVGAFVAGRLSDILGRKRTLLIAAAFFIISAYGSGIAGSSGEFVVYRIIGGLAVGAASVLAPAYISEVTPAAMRGRLSSLQQVMIIVTGQIFRGNEIIFAPFGVEFASPQLQWLSGQLKLYNAILVLVLALARMEGRS